MCIHSFWPMHGCMVHMPMGCLLWHCACKWSYSMVQWCIKCKFSQTIFEKGFIHSTWFDYVSASPAVGKVWYVFKTQHSTSRLFNLCLDLDLDFQAFFSTCSGSFCRHEMVVAWATETAKIAGPLIKLKIWIFSVIKSIWTLLYVCLKFDNFLCWKQVV